MTLEPLEKNEASFEKLPQNAASHSVLLPKDVEPLKVSLVQDSTLKSPTSINAEDVKLSFEAENHEMRSTPFFDQSVFGVVQLQSSNHKSEPLTVPERIHSP